MQSQNRRIDQLVEKIKQQQDKLEKQSLHLQTLQSKVSHTTFNRTPDMTKPTFTGKRTSWRLKRENLRATANQTSAIMRKQKDNVSYPYCNVIF